MKKKQKEDDLKRYFDSGQASQFMGCSQSELNDKFHEWVSLGLLTDVRIRPRGKGIGRPGFIRKYSEDDCRRVRDYLSTPLNNGGILDGITC